MGTTLKMYFRLAIWISFVVFIIFDLWFESCRVYKWIVSFRICKIIQSQPLKSAACNQIQNQYLKLFYLFMSPKLLILLWVIAYESYIYHVGSEVRFYFELQHLFFIFWWFSVLVINFLCLDATLIPHLWVINYESL